jgi:hypothetical protein
MSLTARQQEVCGELAMMASVRYRRGRTLIMAMATVLLRAYAVV